MHYQFWFSKNLNLQLMKEVAKSLTQMSWAHLLSRRQMIRRLVSQVQSKRWRDVSFQIVICIQWANASTGPLLEALDAKGCSVYRTQDQGIASSQVTQSEERHTSPVTLNTCTQSSAVDLHHASLAIQKQGLFASVSVSQLQ